MGAQQKLKNTYIGHWRVLCAALGLLMSATVSFAVDGFGPPYSPDSGARTDSGRDARPIGAGDGKGTWLLVWNSEDPRNGYGPDGDIFFSRTTDFGRTWTTIKALNNNAATDSGHDGGPLNGPWIATDRKGVWICVWESMDSLNGTIGTDNDILYARSLDDGATWSNPAPLNTNAATDLGEDIAPMIEMDADGVWLVAWSSTDSLGGTVGGDTDILYSRSLDDGASWSAPAPLNHYASFDGESADRDVTIKPDRKGGWMAIWSSAYPLTPAIDDDEDIFYARSADGGQTWGAASPLNGNSSFDPEGRDYRPSVDGDGHGNWVCVWYSNENLNYTAGLDLDVLMARSDNDGTTWTWPALIDPGATSDLNRSDIVPTIRTDGKGQWVVVYESNNPMVWAGPDYDILMTRSADNGANWTHPQFLNRSAFLDAGADFSPQMMADGTIWMGVWWSFDTMAGEYGSDADIFYSVSWGFDKKANNAYALKATMPSRMAVGQTATGQVRFTNAGDAYWSDFVSVRLLVTHDPCGLNPNSRISIPNGAKIHPGGSVEFTAPLQAPGEAGVCDLTYQMIEELGGLFGQEVRAQIRIEARQGDDAYLIGSSAPNALLPAQPASVRVDFKNIGLNIWNPITGYTVALVKDTCGLASTPGNNLNGAVDITPDQTLQFEQPVLAPDVRRTCNLTFQMSHNGVLFGDMADLSVKVNGNAAETWSEYE